MKDKWYVSQTPFQRTLQTENIVQTHKRFKIMLFIRTKQDMRIYGVIPFIKLQKTTYTTIKRWKTMKNEMES